MVMASRLGLAIRGDTIAIAVRRLGDAGVALVERSPDEPWSTFLVRELVGRLPRSWRRPSVGVCVADARCRVIPLFGIDLASPAAEVARVFAEAPHSFTLAGPEGVTAGSVWCGEAGWQGVVLEPVLAETLVSACTEARIELRAVAPSADLAGDDLVELARAACELQRSDLAVVDPARATREALIVRARRGGLAATALLASLWALAAPLAIQAGTTWSLEREAEPAARFLTTSPRSDTTRDREASFRELVAVLEEGRGHVTGLLDGVGDVLHDSSAITALRLDERSGALTLVAPQASSALARLVELPGLRRARISGPIERAGLGWAQLERTMLTWDQTRGRR